MTMLPYNKSEFFFPLRLYTDVVPTLNSYYTIHFILSVFSFL